MKVELEKLNNMDIHQKAVFMQDFYEKILFSPSGIAYCMQKIDGDEIRPLCRKDFDGCAEPEFSKWGPRAPESSAAYYTNENSITTSGLYLAAQCYRYKVTGSEKALEQAYKAFNSLWEIYRLSADDGNPGFMCKPYGFKISNQTSGDQYLHASWGMFEFYPLADDETKVKIKGMSVAFIDYWHKANYTLSYMSNHWDMKDDKYSYNAILVTLNLIAWHYTKEQLYLDEAQKLFKNARWHKETNVDEMKQIYITLLDDVQSGKRPSKGDFNGGFNDLFADFLEEDEFLFWEANILAQFVVIAADIIYRIKPDFIDEYMPALTCKWMDIWKYGTSGDYAPHYWYSVNVRTDEWRSMPLTPLLPEGKWPFAEKFMGYMSQIRWGEPLARFMQVAQIAHIYSNKKSEAKSLALNIMNAVDETRVRWMFDFDGMQLLPDLRHMYDILSSEVTPTWLATYWRGRHIGIIQQGEHS